MIVVAGEALIDLIDEDGSLLPFPGGGPYNTAVALGRLGAPVAFLGRISVDRFGRLLATRLAESGVDDRYLLRGPAPTPLALVHETGAGGHEFSFYLVETAYAQLEPAELPTLESDVVAIYAGTLGLATDPPASAIEGLLERESEERVIVVDPNVRPVVFGDRDAYRERFEHWASFAHVLKLSDDDAAWLYPGEEPEAVLDALLERGTLLAVLTLGAEGAVAKTARERVSVDGRAIEVVDTVGAGDAFGAGLLHRLWSAGKLTPRAVGSLDRETLASSLEFAAAVAALQCERAGAVPPSLAEVNAFVQRSPARGHGL